MKIRGSGGYTLAELLIVVAIIAVLVSIAIPIFSDNLEKGREATDLANVRSACSLVMTAAMIDDPDAAYEGKLIRRMQADDSYLYIADVELKQKKSGWSLNKGELTLAGINFYDGEHWHGAPGKSKLCRVSVTPGCELSLYWDAGTVDDGAAVRP